MAVLLNGAGYTGITAQQDADLYAGIVGRLPVVLPIGEQMRAEIVTNNKVRIFDGELLSQGRRIHVDAGTYDDFVIENGAQGATRYDIIGYRIYRDEAGNELAETFVRKDVGATGSITEEIIRDGAVESYISVYKVKISGLAIESLTPLYCIFPALQELENVLSKVGEGKEPGYFPAYQKPGHHAGIGFETLGSGSFVRVVVDEKPFDVIPNNKGQTGNYKIMDVVPSIVDSVWRLTFKIYVDGRIYDKYIELK